MQPADEEIATAGVENDGRFKLDVTLVLSQSANNGQEGSGDQPPLFSLHSLNPQTAPSAEVPWSQLLALTFTQEAAPSVLTVGRHGDCNIRLDDPRVSVHHFEIAARRQPSALGDATSVTYECVLRDCSSNGTTVNGEMVGKGNSRRLKSGDEIVILPISKVGKDNTIGFLFRNMTEVLTTPKIADSKQIQLGQHVTCPICIGVIHKCMAVMPCFHNFCSSCLSQWLLRRRDSRPCPVCRQEVTAVIKNHAMDAVIDAFLDAYPEKRRSRLELRDMDATDTLRLEPGSKLVFSHLSSVERPVLPAQAPPRSADSERVGGFHPRERPEGAGHRERAAAAPAHHAPPATAAPAAPAVASQHHGRPPQRTTAPPPVQTVPPPTARPGTQVCTIQ
mmetsp:Transcript_31630/g.73827  ORF Transcript_31630/g.73827 Transcript_31630/m.73827 type:complete len:391 (-) Transcript_31630:79-1251(-)